jgi:N-acetylglucosaminyldiphosphoundecaprenol N-acetyl-beta-D-mannosaminyltransferase
VLDSNISICNAAVALDAVQSALTPGTGGYVCFTNVHAAVSGRRDPRFRAITNGSLLSVADGRPVYWVGRLKVGDRIGHVPGPDFFIQALQRFATHRHFFYGSTPQVLELLSSALRQRIPGLQICGTLSPPFRPLSDAEKRTHFQQILDSGAEFVWVGLGAPKQEQWMADSWQQLRPCILFGVGAAFDFHAGTVRRAPRWMQQLGLEWLYRLVAEPRRLWRRYLVTNSLFILYSFTDLFRRRSSPRP